MQVYETETPKLFSNERVKDEKLLGHYKNVLHHGEEKIAPGPSEALPIIKKNNLPK